MKLLRIVSLLIIALGAGRPSAIASPAKFWFSSSSTSPGNPAAPVIPGVMGTSRTLHIWAQPATINSALPYNVTSNRFRTLRNWSLNIVTDQPIVDFVDGTFTVHNPQLDGMPRFEFVADSLTPDTNVSDPLKSATKEADVLAGTPDALNGLQAFSVASSGFAGLGHSPNHLTLGCHPADPFCAVTGDGSPAWLLASLSIKTLTASGSAPIYLRIGANGMIYAGDPLPAAEITFGVNSAGPGPVYNARLVDEPNHRGVTLEDDAPDVTINAVAPIPGDFNNDAVVDAADYVTWRDGLGTVFTPPQYDIWRANFGRAAGSGASLANLAVPEPATWAIILLGTPTSLLRRRMSHMGSKSSRNRQT
jgi:hypothetical protein